MQTMPLPKSYHYLGRRAADGKLCRYLRPLTAIEFDRLANVGVPQGFVVWHIPTEELRSGSRRMKILNGFKVWRQGLMPVDPIAALKQFDPARFRLL